MKNLNEQISDAELQILGVVWQDEPATVKHIHNLIKKTKEVGYTTVLKQVQRMHDKGLLSKKVEKNIHTYSSKVKSTNVQKHFTKQLIDHAFGGSKIDLVMLVLGNRKAAKKDLADLEQWVKDQKKKYK